MAKTKTRNHNEWFMPLATVRKSCSECGHKNADKSAVQMYAWGEYVRAKWRTVKHFCKECFPKIAADLRAHAGPCGCTITLVSRHGALPDWITLDI